MIGHANFFRQLEFQGPTEAYDITPAGDPPGLYWGCLLPRFAAADSDTTQGKSLAIEVIVGGTTRFFTRFVNRQLFRPHQAYQNWQIPRPSADNNLVWDTRTRTVVSAATGSLFGSVADASYTWKPTAAPKRSYMNAYFLPATPGPQTSTLPFSVGTSPVSPTESYSVHAEPIHFWIDRQPGQSIVLRGRIFREQPNPALAAPINDDLPTDKIGAEPDEIRDAGNLFLAAWIVRVGRAASVTEAIETYRIGTIGGEV